MRNANSHDILASIRAKKMYLSQRFGVVRVGLFGSAARNETGEQSDIDVYYESESKEFTLSDVLEMEAELEKSLGRKVDLVNLKYMNPLVLMTAQKDFIDA